MDITDTRFSKAEKSLILKMIGKNLDMAVIDKSPDGSTTHKSAWVFSDSHVYEIRNETKPLPYMGTVEDVAILSVRESSAGDVHSRVIGRDLKTIEIGRNLSDVLLFEDTHMLAECGLDIYGYSFTSAIVFELEGTELVFEKPVWFSEDIGIIRGPGARGKVYRPEEMLEESLDPDFAYRVERKVTSLREWAEQGSPE